jgi:hypothetical protein
MVLWPESDDDLPAFMHQMTNMHVKRWKEHRHEIGYQLLRYVQRSALRANLVAPALSKTAG